MVIQKQVTTQLEPGSGEAANAGDNLEAAVSLYNQGLDSQAAADQFLTTYEPLAVESERKKLLIGSRTILWANPTGSLWFVKVGEQAVLLPRWGISREQLADLEDCFEWETEDIGPRPSRVVARVCGPAECAGGEGGQDVTLALKGFMTLDKWLLQSRISKEDNHAHLPRLRSR
jgi:hypothetical protein